MPISKKQRRANRQNDRKSTGAPSPEGRQIVSHNAVIHGVYAILVHLWQRRNSKSFNEDDKKQKIMMKRSHFAPTPLPPTEYREFSEPGPVPKYRNRGDVADMCLINIPEVCDSLATNREVLPMS